jgi:hypothetical protein
MSDARRVELMLILAERRGEIGDPRFRRAR